MTEQLLVCTFAAAAFLPCAVWAQSPPPDVATPELTYPRYEGRYYEIARLPSFSERNCASDVVTTFIRRTDGDVSFVNQCVANATQRIVDIGRIDREASDPKSGVFRFRPDQIGFTPWYWGTYRLVELADDYSYMAFGSADKAKLWILARTRRMNDDTYARLIARAREQGYDVSRLVRSPQNGA
jgi:apolipoprotein D and lipocalin family protein